MFSRLRSTTRDDLAEAERHDRQVVAAQPHRRRAERQAGEAGSQRRRDQRAPEADLERDTSRR